MLSSRKETSPSVFHCRVVGGTWRLLLHLPVFVRYSFGQCCPTESSLELSFTWNQERKGLGAYSVCKDKLQNFMASKREPKRQDNCLVTMKKGYSCGGQE